MDSGQSTLCPRAQVFSPTLRGAGRQPTNSPWHLLALGLSSVENLAALGLVAQDKQTHYGSLPATPPPQGWPNTGLTQHMLFEDLLCGKHSTRHAHKTGKSLALWAHRLGEGQTGNADSLGKVKFIKRA